MLQIIFNATLFLELFIEQALLQIESIILSLLCTVAPKICDYFLRYSLIWAGKRQINFPGIEAKIPRRITLTIMYLIDACSSYASNWIIHSLPQSQIDWIFWRSNSYSILSLSLKPSRKTGLLSRLREWNVGDIKWPDTLWHIIEY